MIMPKNSIRQFFFMRAIAVVLYTLVLVGRAHKEEPHLAPFRCPLITEQTFE